METSLPLNHNQLHKTSLLVHLLNTLILESAWLVGLDELGVLGEELDDLVNISYFVLAQSSYFACYEGFCIVIGNSIGFEAAI